MLFFSGFPWVKKSDRSGWPFFSGKTRCFGPTFCRSTFLMSENPKFSAQVCPNRQPFTLAGSIRDYSSTPIVASASCRSSSTYGRMPHLRIIRAKPFSHKRLTRFSSKCFCTPNFNNFSFFSQSRPSHPPMAHILNLAFASYGER
jgi:hypothetical protein